MQTSNERDTLKTVEEMVRFWNKVSIPANTKECWTWKASHFKNGYGCFRLRNHAVKAYRISYENAVGPIPPGYTVDHLCRNKSCLNPAHLEAVSQRENVLRGRRSALNSGKSSKYPGVTWLKYNSKWAAQIFYDKKLHYLGCFDDEEAAAQAYRNAQATR
jgi:hypothetical protein